MLWFLLFFAVAHAQGWKQDEKMAKTIQYYVDIEKTKEINGVPIPLLNQRALPATPFVMKWLQERISQANSTEERDYWVMEMMMRSYSGYIATSDVDLKTVLQKDWSLVHELNTTHMELASHLRNILSLVSFGNINVSYDANSLPGVFVVESS
eukprot:TRINITY_DN953_c0_g1_i3.p1 TRINITY_DN953_c0_g1~~TRINITY_DN953_c0_g1_i3.p1  ORF type:complete len:153 (-),score=37.64 TRINITY_DN953_c0_g1_i3:448-906(-)